MALKSVLSACSLAVVAAWPHPRAPKRKPIPNSCNWGRASAAIYKSNSGPAPHIGILITHRTGNNLNNIAYREMAKRGFVGVWLNTRFINNEALVKSEGITLDVKAAVD